MLPGGCKEEVWSGSLFNPGTHFGAMRGPTGSLVTWIGLYVWHKPASEELLDRGPQFQGKWAASCLERPPLWSKEIKNKLSGLHCLHLPSRINVFNSGKGSCISFFFLSYVFALGLSCDTWDRPSLLRRVGSSSLARMEPRPPALGAWSLSHWPPGTSLHFGFTDSLAVPSGLAVWSGRGAVVTWPLKGCWDKVS